jgi:L-2,4-diaminobutyrate decarboxylase
MSFESDAHIAVDALAGFLRSSRAGEGPVLRQPPLAELVERLEAPAWIARGGLTGEALQAFLDRYLEATTRLHHPGYMGHQVAVPHPSGAIGSLVDGLTNNAMAIYEMGPAASALEFAVLRWMLEKVGFVPPPLPPAAPAGPCGAGVLVHGGSLANLTALAAARGRADPGAWDAGPRGDLVVLAPPEAHYSIARAVGILGLGQRALRAAPVDGDGRVVPDRLPAAVRALTDEGKAPMAMVAAACSTGAGLYDRLREVGAFCRERGIWLHVDGAHGASALLSAELRTRLDGIALADSVVWDAHKMLRTPTVCAAVLVRDARDLDAAFREEASYLFHDKEQPGFDFIHRTVECTKAALGLRLFLVLAAEGEAGLGAYVERQVGLAGEAAARIAREPGLELAVAPESNIVCFRAAGSDGLQLELRRLLLAGGRHYVTTTQLRGRRWLRLALMSPATGLADVERLLAELAELRAGLPAA